MVEQPPVTVEIPASRWQQLVDAGEPFGLDGVQVLGKCIELGLYALKVEGQNKILVFTQDDTPHWLTMLNEWETRKDAEAT